MNNIYIIMKKSSVITICIILNLFPMYAQNGPVTIVGQHNYIMNNSHTLPQAKIECKTIAARSGILAYLLIFQPETIISEEEINCVYENLFVIDVIEEKRVGNELFMKVLATTNSQTINACTN